MFPTLYVVIVYFMSDQPMEPMRFFMFLTMSVMTSLVAQSLGLVIGAAMEIQVLYFIHFKWFKNIYLLQTVRSNL